MPYQAATREVEPVERTEAVSDLEEALVTLVRVMRLPRVRRELTGTAETGLDRSTQALLGLLEMTGPSRLSVLAETLGLDLSTLSRQLADGVQKGLLRRQPDPEDGRAIMVSLRPAGTAALNRARQARQQALGSILTDWEANDLARLAELLERCSSDLLEATRRDAG